MHLRSLWALGFAVIRALLMLESWIHSWSKAHGKLKLNGICIWSKYEDFTLKLITRGHFRYSQKKCIIRFRCLLQIHNQNTLSLMTNNTVRYGEIIWYLMAQLTPVSIPVNLSIILPLKGLWVFFVLLGVG